jgi:hypothetical protein
MMRIRIQLPKMMTIAYLEAGDIPGSMLEPSALMPVSLGYPSLRSGPCFLTNKEKIYS